MCALTISGFDILLRYFSPPSIAINIVHRIHRNIFQSLFDKCIAHKFRTLFLFEGRRGDLLDLNCKIKKTIQ